MRSFSRLRASLSGFNVRRSLLVLGICGILIADILTGGGLQRRVHLMKKYGQVAMIALVGLGVLLLVNKPGTDNMSMVHTATSVVSSMPSSATTQLLQSGLGMLGSGTGGVQEGGGWSGVGSGGAGAGSGGGGVLGGGAGSGGGGTPKRSVSEARKRAVAAAQGWQCGHCSDTLEATYEVDHIVELQDGGTNDVDNLMALCRNCHGRKTLEQRLRRQE